MSNHGSLNRQLIRNDSHDIWVTNDSTNITEKIQVSTFLDEVGGAHDHDDRYYTESEVDTLLAGKSDIGHTHPGGGGISCVLLRDVKASGVTGGNFPVGRVTRDLTEKTFDGDSLCVLSANQFTLQPGLYIVSADVPAYSVARHQAFLYSVSNSVDVIVGTSVSCWGSNTECSLIRGMLNLSVVETFEIQHQTDYGGTTGLGYACSFGTEIYTIIELWKIGE